MKLLFSNEPCVFEGDSIFLAGPTPRKTTIKSWRPEAIAVLEALAYTGTVLVPERHDWNVKFEYTDQVEWEEQGLAGAKRILFWVPRSLPDMPALTTNVEFGRWITKKLESVTYGRPPEAEHCRYLDWLYEKERGRKPETVLRDAVLGTFL